MFKKGNILGIRVPLVLLFGIMIGLAGCGQATETPTEAKVPAATPIEASTAAPIEASTAAPIEASTVEAPKEVIEIKYYHDATEFDAQYAELGELSAQEIGVRVVPVSYEGGVYESTVRLGLSEGTVTLAKWWSGGFVNSLVDDGLILDLAPVWDDVGDELLPGLREHLTYKETVWSGVRSNATWAWFYNKPLMKKLGLELPKTWDEFVTQLDYLKSQGVYPIGNSPAATWNTFIVPMEISYRIDPVNNYLALFNGKIPWMSDEGHELFSIWGDMLKKGYFVPKDMNYQTDYPGMFARGELMYIPLAAWYSQILMSSGVPAEDIGFFIPPPINPQGAGYVVSETSVIVVGANAPEQEQEAAKRWLVWYMGKSGQEACWRLLHDQPFNINISAETVAKDNPAIAEIMGYLAGYPHVLERSNELGAPESSREAWDFFAEFMLNPDDPDTALQKLQKSYETYVGPYK